MAKCITLSELINSVKALKPECAYTDEQLTMWVNEVEGMVQTDVMLISVDDLIYYDYEECKDHDLLVAFPHSKLYRSYLLAMIDYANGEHEKYQNAMVMFNSHWSEFVRWFARNYRPADFKSAK